MALPPIEIGPDAPRSFLRMLEHRELIRLQKEGGVPYPWTDDPILGKFKFTNVQRKHDATTRALVNEFYEVHRDAPWVEILLNCAIFRYFGTIEFARAIGWTTEFDGLQRDEIVITAHNRLLAGERVFTGAYVITNGGIARPKQEVVVYEYLRPFYDALPTLETIWFEHGTWEAVAAHMGTIPGFGGTGFMTKEVLQDAMLTPAMCDAEDAESWTPIGPGARRGLARVMGQGATGGKGGPLADLLRLREWVNGARDPGILPRLTAHDIQFQLCEFDKYMRVYNGEGKPRSLYHPARRT